MPLTGELEHLPIVDVIQLIHSTRKSGTLNVYSRKGEGKLVFNDGYIISATHSQEKIRIGSILIENEIISQADLNKALGLQSNDPDEHKPLLAIIIETCPVSKELVFKALETLIEMTIVEMISWTRGVFTFDVDAVSIVDEYRYLPQALQDLSLNTQMVLMDALRIFDEKVHAGEIEFSDEPLEEDPRIGVFENNNHQTEESGDIISEDILGLADLDKVERKIPQVFNGLESFDADNLRREISARATESLSDENQKKLADFLDNLSATQPKTLFSSSNQALILSANDPLIEQSIMAVCKHEGRFVFNAQSEDDLYRLIEQSIIRQMKPLVILNAPDEEEIEKLENIRINIQNNYLNVGIAQLAYPAQLNFQLKAIKTGVRIVLPIPQVSTDASYADDMITFLETFQSYLSDQRQNTGLFDLRTLQQNLVHLKQYRKVADVSAEIMRFVNSYFSRAITFVVNKNELIAERSVGILNKDKQLSEILKWRFPLAEDSRIFQLFNLGESFCGSIPDPDFQRMLYGKITSPQTDSSLLLPIRCNNKTVMLIYADNGNDEAQQVDSNFFNYFISQASLIMENALFRKQLLS